MRRFIKSVAVVGLLVSGLGGSGIVAHAGGVNTDTIGPYQTHSYTRYFAAGDYVTVGVVGDGDTRLDLYVYSPHNVLIASDPGPGDRCFVGFWAPESGSYTIQVVNRGSLSNVYVIGIEP
jgi:hypothetical protein